MNFYTTKLHLHLKHIKLVFSALLTLFLLISVRGIAFGQTIPDSLKADSAKAKAKKKQEIANNIVKQYDFGDLTHAILHPKKKKNPLHKGSGITVVPNVAANPTIGAQAGIKAVAGRKLGPDSTTFLSIAATSASITTKGIIYFYVNHNVFTANNKWNFQGNLVVAKTVTPDFGLGIGRDLLHIGFKRGVRRPIAQSLSYPFLLF